MPVTEMGRHPFYGGSMDKTQEDFIKESKPTRNTLDPRAVSVSPPSFSPVRPRLRVERRRGPSRDSFPNLPLLGPNRLPLDIKMAA